MSRRSGRAKQVQRETSKTPEVEQSPDLDEQDEVTRCVCENDEITSTNPSLSQFLSQEYNIKIDPGLFIQCDKCSVWQHGYCVGLFIDNDVPDKYWCEMCKPGLHMFITDDSDQSSRTLYRPVNDERDKLIRYSTDTGSAAEKSASDDTNHKTDKPEKPEKPVRQRGRRSPNTSSADSHPGSKDSNGPATQTTSNRQSRKERRHAEETFDEQLQRALRESAASNESKPKSEPDSEQAEKSGNGSKRTHSEELENEVNESNADEDPEQEQEKETKSAKRELRAKMKQRVSKKARTSNAKATASSTNKDDEESSVPSKEELLSQPSKPRFVNEKSTIYELRKRTGAILEWLGRSQMELEEERDVKTLQFKEANVEGASLLSSVEDNSKLMENLTEKILAWEQRFGKYAP